MLDWTARVPPVLTAGKLSARYGVFAPWVKALCLSTVLLTGWIAAAAAAPPAKSPLILAFGDSLTAGYDLPAADAFPSQLQTELKARGLSARVHNAGVSGDTTSGGKSRLNWVLASLGQRPDLVVLALGANDALRGVDPKLTRANLDAMLTNLGKRKIPVVLVGMIAPPNLGQGYAKAFNPIFADLAKKHGAALYPFFLDGVITDRRLLLSDGLHPNRAGAQVMAKRLAPVVSRALKTARTPT